MNWSLKEVQEVLSDLKTDQKIGLSAAQVQERRLKFGSNELPEKPRDSWFTVFIRQFKSPLIYVLLCAAVIIFFVGKDKFDALVVSGVLFFNAIIGTFQEGRARNILEALQRFIKTSSVVLRDGEKLFIDDNQLVVGDIIFLQEGERVPADSRIIESNNLRIDQAMLTGESKSVHKKVQALTEAAAVQDRNNMVFKGTYILSGSGKAVVVATGVSSQIGQIHQVAEAIDTDMPLKKEMARLSRWILWFILGICVFLFIVGLVTGKPFEELLTTLTALFICVIPEGLPVVLTLVLVSGANSMARRNVLVKRMQGVEALGRADVIIVDKTGTLTRNEMVVSQVVVRGKRFSVSGVGYFSQGEVTKDGKPITLSEHENLLLLGTVSSLINRSEIHFVPELNLFDIKGSPTEIALFILSEKLGLKQEKLAQEYTNIYEIPFDSQLQYHALFCRKDGKGMAFISGSPEKLMQRSKQIDKQIEQDLSDMLQEGLRVVAIAVKPFDLTALPREKEDDQAYADAFKALINDGLTFVGLCGIQDSIRPEVAQTVAQARAAGIRVVMATGDHKKTALFVAKRVGIFANGDCVLEGQEIDKLSKEQFNEKLNTTTVYARVTPKQKLAIVNGLRKQGKIVAMTGDGVNDVPSLVAADLGIAMGRIGTEAAKQASDIILLDDSFVSIMNAVEYGRHIFYTLRRVILYFFSTNMGEVLVVLFALLIGLPLPITAVQILWLNLVTDGFLDTALAAEAKEKGLLKRNARNGLFHLFDWGTLFKMLYMAIPMGVFSLLVFYRYFRIDLVHARSMTLVTMAMFQWFNAWNCRSETKSIFQLGLFSNRWLLLAMAVVFGLQIFVLHNPFMQRLFKTVPISLSQWVLIILLSSSVVLFEEIRKWFVRRRV